jgi:predicted negative regulator of RcsB-dependent stress response
LQIENLKQNNPMATEILKTPRPDLLPNEQEVSYDRIYDFFTKNKSIIVGACFIVILAALGFVAWRYQQDQIQQEAAEKLSTSHSLESLQAITQDKKFAQTESALIASMMLGDLYFKQNQFDKAASAYQSVIDQFPDSPLVASAQIGLAAVLEAQGKLPEAIKKYQFVALTYSQSFQAPQAQLAAARLLEATGRLEESRQTYELLLAGQIDSSFKDDARVNLKRLNAILKKTTNPQASISLK